MQGIPFVRIPRIAFPVSAPTLTRHLSSHSTRTHVRQRPTAGRDKHASSSKRKGDEESQTAKMSFTCHNSREHAYRLPKDRMCCRTSVALTSIVFQDRAGLQNESASKQSKVWGLSPSRKGLQVSLLLGIVGSGSLNSLPTPPPYPSCWVSVNLNLK